MTPQQVELVQQSFEKLAAMGDPPWDGFYIELFAIEPTLKRMFKGDMHAQRKKLLAALALLIGALSAPAKDPRSAQGASGQTCWLWREAGTLHLHGQCTAAHAQEGPRRGIHAGAAQCLGGSVPNPGNHHEGCRLRCGQN